MASRSNEVSVLLDDWTRGDQLAKDKLIPLVYDQLRRLAQRQLDLERPGHTLQATALVNEAYLLLVDQREVRWQNRAHFFALAAQMMRHILVDFARSRNQLKRGGDWEQVSIDEALTISGDRTAELLDLDEALTALSKLDERQSKVVEMRFFGGLTEPEIAEVLQVSPRTVNADWSMARSWLLSQLSEKQRHDT